MCDVRKAVLSGLVTAGLSICAPASAADVHCKHVIDFNAEKSAITKLLKARYGLGYQAFDLDRPALTDLALVPGHQEYMETLKGRVPIDPRRYAWLAYSVPQPVGADPDDRKMSIGRRRPMLRQDRRLPAPTD